MTLTTASGSDINTGPPSLQGPEPAPFSKITAPVQTETRNAKNTAARELNSQPTGPDYEKLLESFKPQTAAPLKEPKRDPPDTPPGIIDEPDPRVQLKKPVDYQTENEMPLVMTAVDLPETNLSSLSRLGGDEPPDDF